MPVLMDEALTQAAVDTLAETLLECLTTRDGSVPVGLHGGLTQNPALHAAVVSVVKGLPVQRKREADRTLVYLTRNAPPKP